MKSVFKAIMPIAALILLVSLVAASMISAGLHKPFNVTFENTDGLFAGVRIAGGFYNSSDDLSYTFSVGAGATVPAKVSKYKSEDSNREFYSIFDVFGDPRYGEMFINIQATLPDDAVISDEEVIFDKDGRAILGKNEDMFVYTDRLDYRFYISSWDSKTTFSWLGETRRANGKIRVNVVPKRGVVISDSGSTARFSTSGKDYHLGFNIISNRSIFPDEFKSPSLAYLEPDGEAFNVYLIDRISKAVYYSRFGSEISEKLCDFDLGDSSDYPYDNDGKELIAMCGENKVFAGAYQDGDELVFRVNDGEYKLDVSGADSVYGSADVSNGIATFRIIIEKNGVHNAEYYVINGNGELVANFAGSSWSPTVEKLSYNRYYSFDTYYDGKRLYLLENIDYSVSYEPDSMRGNYNDTVKLLNKYGNGFIGYIVSAKVIENGKVIASDLHPISMRVSSPPRDFSHVRVYFEKGAGK